MIYRDSNEYTFCFFILSFWFYYFLVYFLFLTFTLYFLLSLRWWWRCRTRMFWALSCWCWLVRDSPSLCSIPSHRPNPTWSCWPVCRPRSAPGWRLWWDHIDCTVLKTLIILHSSVSWFVFARTPVSCAVPQSLCLRAVNWSTKSSRCSPENHAQYSLALHLLEAVDSLHEEPWYKQMHRRREWESCFFKYSRL